MVKVVNNFMHKNDFNHLRQEVLKANFFYNSSVSEIILKMVIILRT